MDRTPPKSPSFIKQRWEDLYSKEQKVDWESGLPLNDLSDFVNSTRIGPGIAAILDVGCGRALRALVLLLNSPHLNRSGVRYFGIDLSENAIAGASATFAEALKGALPDAITSLVPPGARLDPGLTVSFHAGDIAVGLPSGWPESFDLVVDWMCLHEIWPSILTEYVDVLTGVAGNFLILNEFSKECSSQYGLVPAVRDLPKTQFSRKEIEAIFGQTFHVIRERQYPEQLSPTPPHRDGVIAAKRAYWLVRKRTP